MPSAAPAASPTTSIPRLRSTLATPWRYSAHSSTITARRPAGVSGGVEDGELIRTSHRAGREAVEGDMGVLSARPHPQGYACLVLTSDGGRSGSYRGTVYLPLTDPDH